MISLTDQPFEPGALLTAFSLIACLRKMHAPLRVGT